MKFLIPHFLSKLQNSSQDFIVECHPNILERGTSPADH